ncbi:MAG: hypothetical protein JJ992_03605 [Planctomycetes bacterium]|nr:hypothetical protein [Planctomycetota bacterium]
MPSIDRSLQKDRSADDTPDMRFAANDVRLSSRGWLVAVVLVVAAFWLIPMLWQRLEPLNIGPDYRLPYRLGNDYWEYERMCREVSSDETTLLIGDSVLWGHYVECRGTLSHFLNQGTSGERFENLSIDGIHPVALAGLVRFYGGAVRDRRVIVNCNPLWISSPRHDLTSDKEAAFNHPALVPQFEPRIPCYHASISERLGIVATRHIRFFGWANHVRTTYFDGEDLASWTIEHPETNPLSRITFQLPSPDEPPSPKPDPRPWTEKGIRRITPEWVPLDQSLQWQFFRRTVRLLQQRGNRVFVLIGPLNEHMLTQAGLTQYNLMKAQIVDWHADQKIPHYAPSTLPSDLYADLSHPVADGYARLASELLASERFQMFLSDE